MNRAQKTNQVPCDEFHVSKTQKLYPQGITTKTREAANPE
jgi:hypothetical protein